MPLTIGTRLGSYEIVAPLGAGGMGEVYRARDTRLKREVALKVLPEGFSQDADRLARFQREAELLATLNHPNIATVYGLEKANDITAIVLELVEGQTLAERIGQVGQAGRVGQVGTSLPLDEVLAIARQIADALEAAHEKGVIHRDLKPANIKITPDGQVKVLDFGLAKMLESEAAASALSMSPTISIHATNAGVILGTAAYMSPEQARGKAVDKRTDVWAFGCVLYEMLTGKGAFPGEDITDTIALVVRGEPDWHALPADLPDAIRLLVRRCLDKDRKTRISDIGVARFLMTETLAPAPAIGSAPPVGVPRRRLLTTAAVALVAGVSVTAAVAWWLTRPGPPPKLQAVRFTIVPPAAQPLAPTATDRQLAVSPDGTHIAYMAGVATGGGQLMVRAIDRFEAEPVRGITNARWPFFSPDGKWIGFFQGQGAGELKKVSITGGSPITLCRYTGATRGASWGPDDTIMFATTDVTTGLFSVPAGGGEPKVLTKPDAAQGEQDHLFPSVLPGGHAVLFTVTTTNGQADSQQVGVLDLKTGQRKTLIRGGGNAEYLDTGHLVYAAAGSLRAVRFDPVRLAVLSDPVPVVEQVATVPTGAAEFSVSTTGALAYVSGGLGGVGLARLLVWVDRRGREEAIPAAPRSYQFPRLSPDGTRLALEIRDQENDIWVLDLARKTLTRLTFDPNIDFWPIWTPDGRRIVFGAARGGAPNLFWHSADGTGADERLTTSPNVQLPHAFTSDGTTIVLRETTPTGPDIRLLRIDRRLSTPAASPSTQLRAGTLNSEPLIQTASNDEPGDISPDGHWIAYYSNESGQNQVYVRPFPNVDGGRWQISTAGGTRPAWAPSGRELFYLDNNTTMMSVPVQTAPTFTAGNATKLFEGRWYIGQTGRTYDVSRDGQRFLMIKDAPTSGDQPSSSVNINVVLNWAEELKQRIPTR